MKPVRLIPRRRNHEVQRRAFFVPQSAVVGGHDTEAIVAWRQVRVLRLAVVDDFLPVAVLALQLVFEMDLFRRHQAQRGVIDTDVVDFGGQMYPGPEVIWFVVSHDLLDVYWR